MPNGAQTSRGRGRVGLQALDAGAVAIRATFSYTDHPKTDPSPERTSGPGLRLGATSLRWALCRQLRGFRRSQSLFVRSPWRILSLDACVIFSVGNDLSGTGVVGIVIPKLNRVARGNPAHWRKDGGSILSRLAPMITIDMLLQVVERGSWRHLLPATGVSKCAVVVVLLG